MGSDKSDKQIRMSIPYFQLADYIQLSPISNRFTNSSTKLGFLGSFPMPSSVLAQSVSYESSLSSYFRLGVVNFYFVCVCVCVCACVCVFIRIYPNMFPFALHLIRFFRSCFSLATSVGCWPSNRVFFKTIWKLIQRVTAIFLRSQCLLWKRKLEDIALLESSK